MQVSMLNPPLDHTLVFGMKNEKAVFNSQFFRADQVILRGNNIFPMPYHFVPFPKSKRQLQSQPLLCRIKFHC